MIRRLILCLFILFPILAGAQTETTSETSPLSLYGKHRIEVHVGLLSAISASTEVTVDGVTTKSDASGLLGMIAYTYYFKPDFGLFVSSGVLDASATTSVSGSGSVVESAVVMPLLFGVKYQPAALALSEGLRLYGSAAFGPYIGSASNVQAGTTTSVEAYTESALGLRLAVGMDVFFGKIFSFGVGIGYHLVSDFEKRIGSETNYSTPEFSLSFGVIFGG